MIKLEFIFILMGLVTGGAAVVNAFDATNPRRLNNTVFWGLYSVTFLAGSYLSDFASGLIVLGMVAAAAIRGLGEGSKQQGQTANGKGQSAKRPAGNIVFFPALLVPALTVLGTYTLKGVSVFGHVLVDPTQVTQVSLGLATVVALGVGLAIFRPPLLTPVRESRRLLDSVGWAAALPQMLASLGAIFLLADVGNVVASLAKQYIPLDHAFVAVATYTVGMAVFTMMMGNAFAAFPVMTAGIGLPVIVGQFHGNVVIMAAVGMVSGFCGTLMTPLAANFNIVPVRLLELPDQYAVIKRQIPTGVPLLIANTLIMYFCVFRFT